MAEGEQIHKWSRNFDILFGLIGIIAGLTCWFIFNPPFLRTPDIYTPGTLFLLAPTVILFGTLWLTRPYIYKTRANWLRGFMAILGLIMIALGATAIHIDFYRIFSLIGDYPGIIGLIQIQLMAVYLITLYFMVIFLAEAILWILILLIGNSTGWFKWLGILLGIIELALAVTALLFTLTALFLTMVVIIISGLILVFKTLAKQ